MNPALIKAAIAAGLMAVFGWLCYDYGHDSVMADWQAERAEINSKTADALKLLMKQRDETERDLSQSEAKAWEQYRHADEENERLNRELAERPWRVRIERASCDRVSNDTGASTVGDGAPEQYAELSREAARRIAAIGRDADQCEAKLMALQQYIVEIKKPR